jgi:dihydrofolate synthase/folylpolyglutamate synthase
VVGRVQLDHPQLGSTVSEVAEEKAGIIKNGATVISANDDPGPAGAIADEVAQRGGTLHVLDRDFGVEERTLIDGGQRVVLRGIDDRIYTIDLPLHGGHQAVNAACALAAVQAYRHAPLDPSVVRAGFARVRSPGRLELFSHDGVPVLLDGAHNPAAAETLAQSLREVGVPGTVASGDGRRVLVLGIMTDKDIPAMVRILGSAADEVVVTTPNSPRAATTAQLGDACRDAGLTVAACVEDVGAAVRVAADRAGPHGMVVVTGSLYTVGDARAALGGTLV